MEADRTDAAAAGPVVRSTQRGSLFLETERARRMMRRLNVERLGTPASMEREESDQLPEEGPAEQVPEDDGEGGPARPETEQNEPADQGEKATGHGP
jgi:hypothetical protein